MSNTIRKYKTIKSCFTDASDMSVTAFMGGNHGSCIQFTTKNDYVCLSEKQALDLISILSRRLKCEKGFSATDWGTEETVLPSGEIEKDGA